MAIATVTMRNFLATAYATNATHAALYTTAPSGGAQGTEVSGGSPAYARQTLSWSAASASAVTVTPSAFNVPSGTNINGAGVHNSATVSTAFLDGTSVTTQNFASQGTYTLTLTYTQS